MAVDGRPLKFVLYYEGSGHETMSGIFLVVYTESGLLGAVSYPLPKQQCNDVVDRRIDWQENYIDDNPDAPRYTFKCVQASARPKVQTKIADRKSFEDDCCNLSGGSGNYSCEQLPNGDTVYHGYRDAETLVKFKDRLNVIDLAVKFRSSIFDVEVARLPRDLKVEISAIAVRP